MATKKTIRAMVINPWWIAAGASIDLAKEGASLAKVVAENTAPVIDVKDLEGMGRFRKMIYFVDLPRGDKFFNAARNIIKTEMIERTQAIIAGKRVNVWVDEEGKIKNGWQVHTRLAGMPYDLAGKLIIVSAHGMGEKDIDAVITPEVVIDHMVSIYVDGAA